MAKTDLSAAVLRMNLNYDRSTGLFHRPGYSKPPGRLTTKGYRQISINGQRYMAHRLAWLYVHGVWPTDQLDHINGLKDDNRIANLREVSNKQNAENVRLFSHNKSGRTGVGWSEREGMWRADIKHHKRTIHLGRFPTIIDAVAARIRAEREFFTHSPDYAENSPLVSKPPYSLEVRPRPRAPRNIHANA